MEVKISKTAIGMTLSIDLVVLMLLVAGMMADQMSNLWVVTASVIIVILVLEIGLGIQDVVKRMRSDN